MVFPLRRALVVALTFTGLALTVRADPVVTAPEVEGSFHGYPEMWTLGGKKLGDGDFIQWIENQQVHVRNAYDLGDGHRIEESVVFQEQPLVQEAWQWRETAGVALQREYVVDLKAGEASARKLENGSMKEWHGHLRIAPGRTFAGVGFAIALRNLRDRLVKGGPVELEAVAFTPTPRVVKVTVTHAGIDSMEMGDRQVWGDRFVIKPDLPRLVELFVAAPETVIWLTHPYPATFLRWEGALVEPTDPAVRVDVLPGAVSGRSQSAEDQPR